MNPVPVEELERVARAYLMSHGSRSIMIAGLPISRNRLHNRLQQIRERTEIRNQREACRTLLDHPERYSIERSDRIAMRERRARLRRNGLSNVEIALFEGVTRAAIWAHFEKHPT